MVLKFDPELGQNIWWALSIDMWLRECDGQTGRQTNHMVQPCRKILHKDKSMLWGYI